MEEIHSTEGLDREILEDARKKAKKELDGAEERSAAVAAEWTRRADEESNQLRKAHADRIARYRTEVFSRRALDERRIRSRRTERALGAALDSWMATLPRGKLLGLIGEEFARLLPELPEGDLEIHGVGLDEAELKRLVAAAPGKRAAGAALSTVPGAAGSYPALTASVGTARLRCSARELCERALLDRRGELATALLGPEAMDD